MSSDQRRIRLGARGEQIASEHLERAGYRVVERNARCGRLGELDIVAVGGRSIVFCEVKTRARGTQAGPDGPLDAIGPAKRARVRRLAAEWLRTRPQPSSRPPWIRFDAIGVTLDRSGALVALEHVEDAF